MALVVLPGAALSRGGFITSNDTRYRVIGPLGPGIWLRRLYLSVSTTDATLCSVAAAVSGTQDESAAALQRGRPLITRRDGVLSGVACFVWSFAAAGLHTAVLPISGVIRTSSQYLLFGISSTGEGIVAYWNLGVETVEVRREVAVEREIS